MSERLAEAARYLSRAWPFLHHLAKHTSPTTSLRIVHLLGKVTAVIDKEMVFNRGPKTGRRIPVVSECYLSAGGKRMVLVESVPIEPDETMVLFIVEKDGSIPQNDECERCRKTGKLWCTRCIAGRYCSVECARADSQRHEWACSLARRHCASLGLVLNDHKCKLCQKPAIKRCSGCKAEWYCSKECQLKHWKQHKKECGAQQPVETKDHTCEVCHKPAHEKCTRCGLAWYCSKDCQRKDWPQHHCEKRGYILKFRADGKKAQ